MKTKLLILATFAHLLAVAPSRAQSASDLFQQAMVTERTDGDLLAAIELFKRVVSVSTDRSLSARALIQIGRNYERLGLTEAIEAYQRVVDDFTDQQDMSRIASGRLSLLQTVAKYEEPKQIDDAPLKRHVMDIPDTMGQVSPDGRFLSFVEWNSGNVGIINLETGEQTLVNSDGFWGDTGSAFGDVSIWSPDGRELMYLWLSYEGREEEAEIRIYNVETATTRVLVPPGSDEVPFPVAWTDDGSHILAINEHINDQREGHVTDAIILVDVESADKRPVTTLSENWHTFRMDVSPDEKHVVYESFREGGRGDPSEPVAIKILSDDGSEQSTLVDNGLRNYAPIWHQKGQYVLYMSRGGDNTELRAIRVINGRVAEEPLIVYSDFDGGVEPIGIDDDGRYYFVQNVREQNVYEQGVNVETGEMQQNLRLISAVRSGQQRSGALSPNGEYHAFVSEKPGEASLVITNLISGETTIHDLAEFGRIQLPPAQALRWSRDNASVLVQAIDMNVQPRRPVFLSVDAQNGSFVKLHDFEAYNVGGPGSLKGSGYTADGKHIVFASARHIVEVDIGTNSKRVVHEYADRFMVGMSVSPDGRNVAVTVGPEDSSDSGGSSIEVVSIDDGSVSIVDETDAELGYSAWVGISWTPDGKNLVFAENRPNSGQQLYALDIASGKRTAIGEPVFGDDQYMGVQVHPDGDKLTFWRGTGKIQLWVLEGIEL